MKKDSVKKTFKIYNLIMSNFWLLLTTILIGVLIGYLVNKKVPTEKNFWLIMIIIIFVFIGIFNFFYRIIVESIKMNKEEKEALTKKESTLDKVDTDLEEEDNVQTTPRD